MKAKCIYKCATMIMLTVLLLSSCSSNKSSKPVIVEVMGDWGSENEKIRVEQSYCEEETYTLKSGNTISPKENKAYISNNTTQTLVYDTVGVRKLPVGKMYKLSQFAECLKDMGYVLIPPKSYIEVDKIPSELNHNSVAKDHFDNLEFDDDAYDKRVCYGDISYYSKKRLSEEFGYELCTHAYFVDNATHVDTVLTQPMIFNGKTYDLDLNFAQKTSCVVNTSNRRLIVYRVIYSKSGYEVTADDYKKLSYHFIEPNSISQNEPEFLFWGTRTMALGYSDRNITFRDCIDYADSPNARQAILTIEAAKKGLLK